MTTTSLPGPLPLSRVWSGSKVLADDLTGEDLGDVLDLHADAMAWWVLDRSTTYGMDELTRLATSLDLDELAVADLTAADRRAKFEELGEARLVVTNAVGPPDAAGDFTIRPVSMFITTRALICLADEAETLAIARLLTGKGAALSRGGVEAAAQLVIAQIVAGYGEVAAALQTASDELASVLFEERPLGKAEQLRAFQLRRRIAELRRLSDPMRSIAADLRLSCDVREHAVKRQWTLVTEQAGRTADAVDRLRDELEVVFQTSLALADVQLNVIVKKLSGWAAVLAAPTLVGTVVGMNVRLPLFDTPDGFWVYLGLMIAVSVTLFVIFRRKDWI